MRSRALRGLLAALLLLFAGHVAHFYALPLLDTLDAVVYDGKVRWSANAALDDRIVIVDIDEKSLQALGRWPWSRDRMADLVDRLFDDYHASVLGFDVVFAEPDTSSGLTVLDRLASTALRGNPGFQASLKQLRPTLDFDARFAAALRGRPVVLGYYFSSGNTVEHASGALPPASLPAGTFQGRSIAFSTWSGFGANLSVLQNAAVAGGHFNPQVDPDGVTRRVPLLAEYRCAACAAAGYYEALSLAVVRQVVGAERIVPGYPADAGGSAYGAMEWLALPTSRGEIRIPVDENVAALVPFQGPQGHFRYVSAVDVLEKRVDVGALSNRIVLVGTTAPGLLDLRVTPFDATYPGVELHASLIAGMLDGNLRNRPPYVIGADLLVLLVAGGLLVLFLPGASPLRATVITAFSTLVLVGVNLWAWSAGLVLPLAAGVGAVITLYGVNMSWGYFVESAAKRQFAALFGHYVPPELVAEMARNPARYSMAGRKADLTVLFADVRGFTAIAEALPPDELALLMNEYLGQMTAIIRRYQGTLDKYMGDAIMAFWGAPVEDPDHARHAVAAALEMQQAVTLLNTRLLERGWPALRIGIGINTGVMTVGDMGSSVRRAYTVLGDAVNVAARLEPLGAVYGAGIVVGEETRQRLKGQMVLRELDRVRVKGRSESLRIFEPLGIEGAVSHDVAERLKLWNQVLRAYRQQLWDQAEVALLNLERMAPDALYRLYTSRIAALRRSPPADGWDAVTRFDSKDAQDVSTA